MNISEIDTTDETREEKMYRNWMNSMGVDPYVNWLYNDLCSGVIIFQVSFSVLDVTLIRGRSRFSK